MVHSHCPRTRPILRQIVRPIKMDYIELYESVHTALRPYHWCHWLSHFSSVSLSVSVSGSVKTPLLSTVLVQKNLFTARKLVTSSTQCTASLRTWSSFLSATATPTLGRNCSDTAGNCAFILFGASSWKRQTKHYMVVTVAPSNVKPLLNKLMVPKIIGFKMIEFSHRT